MTPSLNFPTHYKTSSKRSLSSSCMLTLTSLIISLLCQQTSAQLAPISGLNPGDGSSECNTGQYLHFELVTGQVYTAPDDMLDSRPGTLMLTDCIDLCRSNSSCRAANFETGLCVLFSSSAREFPGRNYSECKFFYNSQKNGTLELQNLG